MDIIKRESEIEKETVSTRGYNEKMQVSYNNYGHLVLRFFSDAEPTPVKDKSTCKNCDEPIYVRLMENVWYHENGDHYCDNRVQKIGEIALFAVPNEEIPLQKPNETLIVLDKTESTDLIRFVKNALAGGRNV